MTDRPGEGYVFRYSQALKRLLSAKSGEPLHELAPELVAAIILELDRPEYHALLNQVDWTTEAITVGAGGVGTFAQVQVENPTGSGLLVVVTKGKVIAPQAQTYVMTLDGALAGAPAANIPLDTRVKSVASKNRILNTGVGVSGTNLDSHNGVLNNDFVFDVPPITITPGHRVSIFINAANIALSAAMFGYERPLETEELTV